MVGAVRGGVGTAGPQGTIAAKQLFDAGGERVDGRERVDYELQQHTGEFAWWPFPRSAVQRLDERRALDSSGTASPARPSIPLPG